MFTWVKTCRVLKTRQVSKQHAFEPVVPLAYSLANASIGSSPAALRAGR
jgi:hypothetical protein